MDANEFLPFQNYEISIELYLLINHDPDLSYTTQELMEIINEKWNENISLRRIREVCNLLAARNYICKLPYGHENNYSRHCQYRALDSKPKYLIGGVHYQIVQTLKELEQNGSTDT